MSADDRLRLAYLALHPDRARALLADHGDAAGVLAGVRRGAVKVPDAARRAGAVDAETRRAELAAAGIHIVLRGESGYPEALDGRPDPPDLLFVMGRLPDRAGVAIVGTRRCTAYGRRLAHRYAAAVADAGWVTVSGLARGIDGAAHEGTVGRGGPGLAILGCGVDVAYPPEHRRLGAALLASGGGIASEYPPGTPPHGWRFPPRNRIIAGLSAAVVVVEAGVTGGALITARLALDAGIPVFAVPGDVERDSSRGTNQLIRDGAHPVFDAADLIEELQLVLGPAQRTSSSLGEAFDLVDRHGPAHVGDLVARSGRSAHWLEAEFERLIEDGHLRRFGDVVMTT